MKTQKSNPKAQHVINFFYEASALKRLQRTGWQILGGNGESVAEHSYMVTVISLALSENLTVDTEKLLLMALFHDFCESRTGDVYKLADFYTKVDEEKAVIDSFGPLGNLGNKLINIIKEYDDRKLLESLIVHDADTLALCLELKQMLEKGHENARQWYNANLDKLKLDNSKILAKEMSKTNSQDWWKKEREKIHKSFGK